MTAPLADLIRSMAADGCSIEIIAKAVEVAELHGHRRLEPSRGALRQRRWRERLKASPETSHGGTIGGEVLEPKKIKKERKSLSCAAVTPSRFPEFKAAYPKRAGSYDWPKAEQKFHKLVKEGVPPETLIEGAEHYAKQQEALEKIGTEYVKMPASWLGVKGWEDGEQDIGDEWDREIAKAIERGNDRELQKNGHGLR